MVESEMADLARENGLRSREVCQGLEDPDHSHTRCRLTVPTGGHDAAVLRPPSTVEDAEAPQQREAAWLSGEPSGQVPIRPWLDQAATPSAQQNLAVLTLRLQRIRF